MYLPQLTPLGKGQQPQLPEEGSQPCWAQLCEAGHAVLLYASGIPPHVCHPAGGVACAASRKPAATMMAFIGGSGRRWMAFIGGSGVDDSQFSTSNVPGEFLSPKANFAHREKVDLGCLYVVLLGSLERVEHDCPRKAAAGQCLSHCDSTLGRVVSC